MLARLRFRVLLLIVLAPWWALACSSQEAIPDDALRVLFVGNSYTYTYDIPDIVAQLAEAAGGRPLYHRSVVAPGISLEDHWQRGEAKRAIEDGAWDYVVMQQGPSSLASSQAHLREWTTQFAETIRSAGGEPAVYMVWPEQARRSAFEAVVTSYTGAAEAANALLLPVGAAWQVAWQQDASLPLYGPDGLHPSQTGAYFAALVMYAGLFQQSPEGLPNAFQTPNGQRFTVPQARAALLKITARNILVAATH